MTPAAVDEIRSRQRAYLRKSRLLSLSGWLCLLPLLAISTINVWTGPPFLHSMKWLSLVAWVLYFIGLVAFQRGIRARRYRKAADILAGAVVRLEVNPALPDEYWSGIEAKVERALRAPVVSRARRSAA